jgi:hypothetical protein
MNNKQASFGPVALTNAVANYLNPATASGGVNAGSSAQYLLVKWIDFVNKTGVSHNFSAWLGATGASAAGTEVIGTAYVVPANTTYRWNGPLRIDSTQFLTMQADANTAITISGEMEVGVSG